MISFGAFWDGSAKFELSSCSAMSSNMYKPLHPYNGPSGCNDNNLADCCKEEDDATACHELDIVKAGV